MTRLFAFLVVLLLCTPVHAVSLERVFHRDGQTFITWNEVSTSPQAAYRVYRFTSEPNLATLAGGVTIQLVPTGSSIAHQYRRNQFQEIIRNFFIDDLRDGGEPLPDSTGLLVWTPKAIESAWYVVTFVDEQGVEQPPAGPQSVAGPIAETDSRPRPIMVATLDDPDEGRTRARAWLQYMDLEGWNTSAYSYFDAERTPVGYAFVYTILDPAGHDGVTPAGMVLDFHGANNRTWMRTDIPWPVYYMRVDDPLSSYWYGWSSTHDYQRDGLIPATGPLVNYTEQQVLRAFFDTLDNPHYQIDRKRVTVTGYSMGGGAAISFSHRHGNLFAVTYASQFITQPLAAIQPGSACPFIDPLTENLLTAVGGVPSDNLPVEIRAPWMGADFPSPTAHLEPFNGMPAWRWFDFVELLEGPVAEWEMPFLMIDHAKFDCVVSWDNQPLPYYDALERRRIAFSAATVPTDHIWASFAGYSPGLCPPPFFPPPNPATTLPLIWCDDYTSTRSFPAFSNNSGNPVRPISQAGTDYFHRNIIWSRPGLAPPLDGDVIDTESTWEARFFTVPLEDSDSADAIVVDITPRRRQAFLPTPGTELVYTIEDPAGTILQRGNLVVEEGGLFTIPAVPIDADGVTLSIHTALFAQFWSAY